MKYGKAAEAQTAATSFVPTAVTGAEAQQTGAGTGAHHVPVLAVVGSPRCPWAGTTNTDKGRYGTVCLDAF